MVDAEAPNGELQWQPTPVTAEEYENEIALWQKQGRTAVESIALDRLGTVVKTACLLATRNYGAATRIRTSSDDENVWMRAINNELGFLPVEFEILLHKQRQGPTG